MTYEEWNKLTDEEQEQIPDEELPEIPPEQLENALTYSKMERKDGKLGWSIRQKITNGENVRWFPVYMCKMVEGQKFWYKFDPTTGLYSLNVVGLEPAIDEEPIGNYGREWMHFMEENYIGLVDVMRFHNKFLTVARAVEDYAFSYKLQLDEEYEKEFPRPTDFEECLKWEYTRQFYTNGTVMRERVLVPYTEDILEKVT